MRGFKSQPGISGMETAIIFISFVILAAVFAYTVLSAGLFTTQKSQEAINSGLKSSESTVVLKSAVLAKAENTGSQGYLSQLTFTLSMTVGGESIDFTPPLTSGTDGLAPIGSPNSVVISYKDDYQQVENLFWTVAKYGRNDGDNMLEAGEKFMISVGNEVAGQDGGNLVDALSRPLGTDSLFTIEVKTTDGATLIFQRITPAWIDRVTNLDTTRGVNLQGAN